MQKASKEGRPTNSGSFSDALLIEQQLRKQ